CTRHSLRPRSRGARLPKQSSGDQRRETVKPYLPFEIRFRIRGLGQSASAPCPTVPSTPCYQKGVGRVRRGSPKQADMSRTSKSLTGLAREGEITQ
ncbi:hypothetical protein, partial [Bradyrhizobium sp.]|uniref:hypothetical protein n=1 Tax=Bradyrhizobium sp. TaxID=376 RepID=UPI003C6AAEE3